MERVALQTEAFDLLSLTDSLAAEWDSFVESNPATGFMQKTAWAKFKSKMGQVVRLVVVRDGERLVAGALLYSGSDEKRPSIMVSPYGPVLPWDNESLARKCLGLIMNKAEQIAMQLNLVSLRIEPRVEHPVPSFLSQFGRGPCNLVPAETLLLDLRLSEEELLSQMKAKCRYNISLSRRKGLLVREHLQQSLDAESLRKAVDDLYDMLEEASDRDDFYLEPKSFFESLIGETCVGRPNSFLRLFTVEHEGELLGALLMVLDGPRATYLYGGISNSKRNTMPGYALQWAAITYAKAAGCLAYDFYGFDQFSVPGHSYARFSRFKSGFGGRAVRYIGAQDYVFMDKLVDNVVAFFKDLNS